METAGLSARLLLSRPGETLVAVLGVALGVGALVGVSTLLRGYDEFQARLARNPISREITVAGFRGPRDGEAAVVSIDDSAEPPQRLSLADGQKVLSEVTGLEAVYQYQSRRFVTSPLSAERMRSLAQGPGGPGPQPGEGGMTLLSAGGAAAPLPPGGADPLQELLRAQEIALAADAKEPVDEVSVEELRGLVVSPSFFAAFGLEAASGSLFDERDQGSESKVAVLGASLAKTLFKGQEALGKRLRLNGTAYSVMGILKPDPWEDGTRQLPFDAQVFVPQQSRTLKTPDGRTLALASSADSLSIMAAPERSPARAGKDLQAWFDRSYGQGRVRVATAAARFEKAVDQRKGVLLVLSILAGAAASAAAVNLFNIMAGRILKRAGSYAVMRAVGATANRVFASVMAETALAAGLGALLSLLVSPLLFHALEGALTAAGGGRVPIRLDLAWLLAGTFVATAAAIVLVAAPARSAARAPIADALKTE